MQPVTSLTEYRRGVPPAGEGPRRCIVCRQLFGPGEPWRRVTRYNDAGDNLTVAQHSPDCEQAREAATAEALATAPELL